MKKLFYMLSLRVKTKIGLSPIMEELPYTLLINIRFVPSYWVMMKYLIIRSTISTNVL